MEPTLYAVLFILYVHLSFAVLNVLSSVLCYVHVPKLSSLTLSRSWAPSLGPSRRRNTSETGAGVECSPMCWNNKVDISRWFLHTDWLVGAYNALLSHPQVIALNHSQAPVLSHKRVGASHYTQNAGWGTSILLTKCSGGGKRKGECKLLRMGEMNALQWHWLSFMLKYINRLYRYKSFSSKLFFLSCFYNFLFNESLTPSPFYP